MTPHDGTEVLVGRSPSLPRTVLQALLHHRSNLIGMGILPLRLRPDRRPQDLRLRADDIIQIDAPREAISPRAEVAVRIMRDGAQLDSFVTIAAIETNLECETLHAGGLLPLILRRAKN